MQVLKIFNSGSHRALSVTLPSAVKFHSRTDSPGSPSTTMRLRLGTQEGKATCSQTGSWAKAFPRSLNLLISPVIYLRVGLISKANIYWILLQDRLSSSQSYEVKSKTEAGCPSVAGASLRLQQSTQGQFPWKRRGGRREDHCDRGPGSTPRTAVACWYTLLPLQEHFCETDLPSHFWF